MTFGSSEYDMIYLSTAIG